MVAERVKKTVGVSSNPGRGQNYRIAQTAGGRTYGKALEQSLIYIRLRRRHVFKQILVACYFDRRLRSQNGERLRIEIERNNRPHCNLSHERLETVSVNRQTIIVERHVVKSKIAVRIGLPDLTVISNGIKNFNICI